MNKTITPKVSMSEFDNELTKAMQGDVKAITFINSLTTDRADGMGFDMFSKQTFWSDRFNHSSSITAIVTPIYNKYRLFRQQLANEAKPILETIVEGTVIDDNWSDCISPEHLKALKLVTGLNSYERINEFYEGWLIEEIIENYCK